jgi:hypothetical protein
MTGEVVAATLPVMWVNQVSTKEENRNYLIAVAASTDSKVPNAGQQQLGHDLPLLRRRGYVSGLVVGMEDMPRSRLQRPAPSRVGR